MKPYVIAVGVSKVTKKDQETIEQHETIDLIEYMNYKLASNELSGLKALKYRIKFFQLIKMRNSNNKVA